MPDARSGSSRGIRAGGLALLLVLAGTGCGTPPWQTGASSASPGPATKTAGATASPSRATAAPAPSTPAGPVQNDLSTGSAKRTIDAGGVRLKINYWSTLDLADWTGPAGKSLNLSASAKFIDGSEQDIFLSKVSVNVAVAGAAGPLTGPDPLVDSSSVSPGYLITSPSSYGQVFTIPALATGARAVTLTITYELLVQSAPKAKTYAKQTGSNDLVIPIAA